MDLVFNIAKGAAAYYATLPGTNDALGILPLETTGLVGDATMRDYDTVADILAGASNEQTTMGRKTLANVAVTTDDTADEKRIDADNPQWTSGQMAGNAVSAFVVYYDPDTTGGTDADLIPLVKLDRAVTPDGNAFELQFDADGFYAAGDPV